MNKEEYINKQFLHDRGQFNKELSLNARSFTIANEIASGLSYRQIVAKYMKEWNVSYNFMRNAINEAIEMFSDETIYKNLKAINNERLSDIYSDARMQGKLAEAIKAVDTMNKLNGLYNEAPQTQINVGNDKITITFGGEDLSQPETAETNIIDTILNEKLELDK